MKNILFFLFFGGLWTLIESCSTEFAPDLVTASGKLCCVSEYKGKINIRPHYNYHTILRLSTKKNQVKIYVQALNNKSRMLVLMSEHPEMTQQEYIVGPKEGYILELQLPSCDNNTFVEYNMERKELKYGVCRAFQQTVGHKIKVIQHYQQATYSIHCRYQLLPRKQNETLYLLSSKEFILFREDDAAIFVPQLSKLHVIDNFGTAFFYVDYLPEGRGADEQHVNEVIGVLSNRSCTCKAQTIAMAPLEKISLQSPGYPDFLCPNTTCTKTITMIPEMTRSKVPKDYIERMLVSVDTRSQSGVSLKVETPNSELLLDGESYQSLSTNLLLESSDVNVSYKTGLQLSIGYQGHYKMNITSVLIHKDCDCSMVSKQGFDSEFRVKVEVPEHCLIISCYWKLEGGSKISGDLNIQLKNGGENDQLQIWNRNMMEIFNSNDLKKTKKIVIHEEKSATHMLFWRTSKGEDATVLISWEPEVPRNERPYNQVSDAEVEKSNRTRTYIPTDFS